MSALTPSFVFDLESRMSVITENEFLRATLAENQWWKDVAKLRTTGKKREIIAWLLSTSQIYDAGKMGGNIRFDDMAATFQEYDVRNAAAGLKLTRNQVEDNDDNGLQFAAEWSQQMGALMAWWPQQQIANLMINGATATALAYDNVQFFADNVVNGGNGHPLTQFQPSRGKYFNWMHGAASGVYPGALPIDESVTVDVALKNVQIALSYIRGIKMPNGITPRFLKAVRLMVAPRLTARAQMLTNAKTIAQAAGTSGGGGADVSAVISNWGFMQPIEVDEFAAVTLGDGASSDLVWYLACETMASSQLGSLVYVDREPFKITYYTGAGGGTGTDAILDRSRELEWHLQGRNIAGYGHPYGLFRFDPT